MGGRQLPTLYGVSLGPGNPKLLTLRAVEVLREAPKVFVPSSKGISRAEAIVSYFTKKRRIIRLDFPMVKDEAIVAKALQRNASRVCSILQRYGSCAYAALGDLSLYSTFWRLYPYVKEKMHDLDIEVIPGVPSFCACAASAKIPLALGDDIITIIPLSASRERIENLARYADTSILLKIKPSIIRSLKLVGKEYQQAVLAMHCSTDNEQVRVANIKELEELSKYFALMIVKRRKFL
ncbi:MAG: precorrin-2 C(20)-methyltransferase [Thermoplasmata archaeon]|nr:MAG: precorrin-2 C(20)-methyltransferase [Thermoplasmata archaeon]